MEFKKLIFVSGKGGTGKTSLALLLSRHLALKGKKVLFVELSKRSSAQALTRTTKGPEYRPTATPWGFDWSLLTGHEALTDYLGSMLKVQSVVKKVFESRILKGLVNVAPGLNDLAVLGKLTSGVRDHGPGWDYDHLVVDAPSTGSFRSLLAAPKLLGQSVSHGPMHTQSMAIDQVLSSPETSQYLLLGLPEVLPMDELLESLSILQQDYPGQVNTVLNKFLPIDQTSLPAPLWQEYLQEKINLQNEQKDRLVAHNQGLVCFPLLLNELDVVLSGRALEEFPCH